jgi:hypothetical protein
MSLRNSSITPGNSAWIAERAGVRRCDFVDNAQHFQVIPTKVGIQMFSFGVRLPSVIEQLGLCPWFMPWAGVLVANLRLAGQMHVRRITAARGNHEMLSCLYIKPVRQIP